MKIRILILIGLIILLVLVMSFTKPYQAPVTTPTPTTVPTGDLIHVTSPLPGATTTSPITITGEARGMWFFEGSFPVSVVDWDGKIIGQGIAEAQGEWMTENFVPFTAIVQYTVATSTPSNRGTIILKKDNPSDMRQYDDAIEIPVILN